MPVNIGPKIGIDGEAEFRRQLNQIISASKTLASEMKAVTTSFKENDKSQDSLSSQSAVLTKQIENQKKEIELLKKGLADSTEKFGEADTRTQKWKKSVYDATAELNQMNGRMDELENGVDDTSESFQGAEKSAASFGDVLKANVLGQAIVDGIKKIGRLIKENITDALNLASDLQEVENVVDKTFGNSSDIIDAFAKSAASDFGVGELQAKQFTGTIGAMFKSMGLGEQDVLNMSQGITQLAGDMASFYNLDPEEAFEKLRSGISGETEPLKQLGINMSVANLEAYALSEGITKAYKDMDQAEQATLRYNYIMSATADAQGDFAATSGSFANQQRILQLNIDNLKSSIGEGLLPVVTEMIAGFNEWIQTIDLSSVTESISQFFAWIQENKDYLIAWIAAIGAGFVAWNVASMITGVVGALQSFKTASEGASIAQKALNLVMSGNLFGVIVTAIAGVVAAITVLWNTNEDFRNAVIAIWDNIKQAIGGFVGGIVSFFTETVPGGINKLTEAFENVKNGIKNKVSGIKEAVINGITEAINWIKSLPEQAKNWGRDMIQGFIGGIQSKVNGIINSVKGIGSTIRSYLHFSRPDVGPLRDYESWMPDMIEGMRRGIERNAYRLEGAVSVMAGRMVIDANPGSGSSSINWGGVTINVYGKDGQNVNELADAVSARIEALASRRRAVTQ